MSYTGYPPASGGGYPGYPQPGSGYGPPPPGGAGYPPTGGYPQASPASGYPPAGYPPATTGYLASGGNPPAAGADYPRASSAGYPPAGGAGYSPPAAQYPQVYRKQRRHYSYTMSYPGYPPAGGGGYPGYPQPGSGYGLPPTGGAGCPPTGGYPQAPPAGGYPPAGYPPATTGYLAPGGYPPAAGADYPRASSAGYPPAGGTGYPPPAAQYPQGMPPHASPGFITPAYGQPLAGTYPQQPLGPGYGQPSVPGYGQPPATGYGVPFQSPYPAAPGPAQLHGQPIAPPAGGVPYTTAVSSAAVAPTPQTHLPVSTPPTAAMKNLSMSEQQFEYHGTVKPAHPIVAGQDCQVLRKAMKGIGGLLPPPPHGPGFRNRDQQRGPAIPLPQPPCKPSCSLKLPDMERPLAPDDHPSILFEDKILAEHGFSSAEVDPVFALGEEYELSERIGPVKAVGTDLQRARDYLKECGICFSFFVMQEMVSLPFCQCRLCIECFAKHFTHLTKTTLLMYKYCCPACEKPDLENCDEGDFQTYFLLLGCMMKNYLQKKDYELYERKLTRWGLVGDPNFRWCAHGCGAGFINERCHEKIQCPECKKHQCFYCNQPWLDEHNNISCEEFGIWKKSTDTEMRGLVSYLKENGIDCPKCKMRYELAKGGCIHVKCTHCHHEFCCGCNLPFLTYPACNQFQSCKGMGLHAHHPRDCFYYLRDKTCDVLQQLLQKHNVYYNKTANASSFNEERSPVCPTKEQQETPDGLVDAICGKPLKDQCGLCENHHKEYLVGLINQHYIDPVEILDVNSLEATLRRNDKQIPNRNGNETDAAYCARLRKEVQQQLPLRQ